jgi:heptosyltransferase-2
VSGYIQSLWHGGGKTGSGRLLLLLLAIPAFVYGRIMALRAWCYRAGLFRTFKLPRPVISVGNITVGGTGKTPVTAWIASYLIAKGLRVAVLSRGYGGALEGSCAIVSDGNNLLLRPEQCGDEPCLLAGSVPGLMVVIGSNRYQAGMLAMEQLQPDIFLLDDGFQHLRLHRDLNILLMDASKPLGNGQILPAGPLREPVTAYERADLLIYTRYQPLQEPGWRPERAIPTCSAGYSLASFVVLGTGEKVDRELLVREPVVAFAGIAQPTSFFASLQEAGIRPCGTQALADHETYSQAVLLQIKRLAEEHGASWLVTTEKDGVKLVDKELLAELNLVVARMELKFYDDPVLLTALDKTLSTPSVLRHAGASAQRILVRSTNWIGDAVMTTPALAAIRQAFPQSEITILANPLVSQLFLYHPWVDHVITFDRNGEHKGVKGRLRLAAQLKKKQFDLALILPNSFDSALIPWLARIPERLGKKSDGRGWLLTDTCRGDATVSAQHEIDYYLNLMAEFGIKSTGNTPQLFTTAEEDIEAEKLLLENGITQGISLLGINAGASYGSAKRWYPERFASVASQLSARWGICPVLFGGPGEQDIVADIEASLSGNCINLVGKTSVRQLMALIKRCSFFVTNDSGPMHIAAAFNVPLVAIFGPTDHLGTAPFSERAVIIRKAVDCAPCKLRNCPTDHRCMTEVTAEDVFHAAVSLKENYESKQVVCS